MRRRKRSAQVEQSRRLRWLVLCATWWAMLTLASVSGIWPTVFVMGIVVALGHWYSARHTGAPDTRLRLLLCVCLLVALGAMYADITVGAFGGAVPQAKFGIWAQVITSFELRTRRNLYSTTLHSFVIMYPAALLSFDVTYGLFLLVFLLICAAILMYTYVVDERASGTSVLVVPTSEPFRTREGAALAAGALAWLVGLAAVAGCFFLVQPRFPGRQLFSPVSISIPVDGGYHGQILSPAFQMAQLTGRSTGNTGYFGFNSNLDLRYRQRPSTDVVMYVRSPVWSYWRGITFDHYTGTDWQITDLWTQRLPVTRGGFFRVPPDAGSETEVVGAGGREAVQTFYYVRDMPNIVYAAYWPYDVYFPSDGLFIDHSAGLRASRELKAGTTYSILSRVPALDAATLRSAGDAYPSQILSVYLQLPAMTPRVLQLAKDITAHELTNYDRMLAIDRMLRTACVYDLSIPVLPPGKDATDQFLFVDKRGYCEQFATAEVVLARLVGIPARLAVGYAAGEFNAVTGLYTVRASDAHGWAEAYFPGVGWVLFDASAGAPANPSTRVPARWLLPHMRMMSPSSVHLGITRLAHGGIVLLQSVIGASLSILFEHPVMVGVLLVALALLGGISGVYRLVQKRRVRWRAQPASSVAHAYDKGVTALGKAGFPVKLGSQTPLEYLDAAAVPDQVSEDLQELTALANRVLYDQQSETPEEARRAETLAKSLGRYARRVPGPGTALR